MKLIILIMFFLLQNTVLALTFPIDDENLLHRNGRVLLTGWYNEDREGILHRALDIPANVHTHVRSATNGKVIEIGFEYNTGQKQAFGNYIKILDDEGFNG